ncbi:MAG: hypothetical protein ACYC8T_12280 [Myxococcaceae bacterium]
MESSFAAEVYRARLALDQRRKRLAMATAGVAVCVVGYGLASSGDLAGLLPFAAIPVIIAGAVAATVWRSGQAIRARLERAQTEKPDFYFSSEAAGLVFLAPDGIFSERHARGFLTYADSFQRLESVAYEEDQHVLLLQLVVVTDDGEQRLKHRIPLPREVSPQTALAQAVQANRRAAAA